MNNDPTQINEGATTSSSLSPMLDVNEAHGGQFDGATNNSNDSSASSHLEYEIMASRMTPSSSSFHDEARMRMPSSMIDEQQQNQHGLRFNGQRQPGEVTRGLSSESSGSNLEETPSVLADLLSSTSDGEAQLSFHPALDQQHRRLSEENDAVRDATPATIGHAILKKQKTERKRTLVVYSGPTSLDPTIGKNGVYLNNFEYFIQHGIECHGLGGTSNPEQPFEDLNLQYVIVLTQEVADKYTAEDGLITRKQSECRAAQQEWQLMNNKVVGNDNSLITVLVREDRCYDMESLLLVSRTYDIPHLYDHMVYINCGLAGPHFGPGSPEQWEHMSSWTELYTSLLSDKVQMVGHTINTHFNTVYSPHVQSFLFAVNTPMIDIWRKTGAIYECGISNEDFKDDLVKMALVWRYEVGISRVLLERGHSIAAAFMHQQGTLGVPLIMDNNSTFGRHFGREDIIHSDVFLEEGMRRLTESSFPEYDDYRKYAILPWDCYVFFKVSRLIPSDIQDVMHYDQLGPVAIVPNDARRSSAREWRRRAGVSILGEFKKILPGVSYIASTGSLRCYGRHCEFEEVATATGELVGALIVFAFLVWYVATATVVEKRISLERLKRRKWN
mmetsp:Transcript_10674/g.19169  ORF Transcript_10674/g.19169 Transcript_10674/m.19169 type:complete len:615 (-) Transcript_10674:1114-2958(-)